MKKYFELRDPPMGGSSSFLSLAELMLPCGRLSITLALGDEELLCDRRMTKINIQEKCNLCG